MLHNIVAFDGIFLILILILTFPSDPLSAFIIKSWCTALRGLVWAQNPLRGSKPDIQLITTFGLLGCDFVYSYANIYEQYAASTVSFKREGYSMLLSNQDTVCCSQTRILYAALKPGYSMLLSNQDTVCCSQTRIQYAGLKPRYCMLLSNQDTVCCSQTRIQYAGLKPGYCMLLSNQDTLCCSQTRILYAALKPGYSMLLPNQYRVRCSQTLLTGDHNLNTHHRGIPKI